MLMPHQVHHVADHGGKQFFPANPEQFQVVGPKRFHNFMMLKNDAVAHGDGVGKYKR
jgi:hypothetical protein